MRPSFDTGHTLRPTRPTTDPRVMGPKLRLSSEVARRSPMTQSLPGPTCSGPNVDVTVPRAR